MQLEYQQTFEDFCEGQKAHGIASVRSNPQLRFAATGWMLATIACSTALVYLFDPWSIGKTDLRHWFIVCIVVPTLPWVFILSYVLWFQLRLSKITGDLPKPWERVAGYSSKPVNRYGGMKVFRSGIMTLGVAIAAIAHPVHYHDKPGADSFISIAYGYGIASMPWGIYMLWAGALKRGQLLPALQSAWKQQTQLHEITRIGLTVEGVIVEAVGSRAEYKWTAISGILETTGLFLMYRSAAMFYIIPKRAFASDEEIAAFRTMLANLAGRATSGFPVLTPIPQQERPAAVVGKVHR